jgi:hypothetical protein
MKITTTLLLLTLLATTTGCASSQPRVNWPGVVQCGTGVASDLFSAVVGLLTDSSQNPGATIGDQAVSQLEQLAIAHGPSVVACLVHQAVASFDTVAAAPRARELTARVPAEAQRASVAAARGRDFLQRVAKTHVEASDTP